MDAPATWSALMGTLVRGEALTADDTAWAMGEIMEGAATPAQIAGFGVALRMKGETAAELSGLAQTMLDRATPISVPGPLVDLVGTGGDGARTVNISTMGAIVAAAAGGGGRDRVPVRAAVSPGSAAHGRAPARTRGADGLQLPRPGGQPGPSPGAGGRRFRSA